MLHFLGILHPAERPPRHNEQKPFFGPDWRQSRAEQDAMACAGKWWPVPSSERDELAESGQRFVSLLSPPYI